MIDKETKLRLFNAANPSSGFRPLLFNRLYPYLKRDNEKMRRFWQNYFLKDCTDTDNIFYSHVLRWQHGAFIANFLNQEVKKQIGDYDPIENLRGDLDGILDNYSPLARAFFLEVYLFLGNYLLSSQGDRMLMSHSVEGRYPFLDRRVIEFACSVPAKMKLRVLTPDWILYRPLF